MRRLALACTAFALVAACAAQTGSTSSITGHVLVNPLSVSLTVPAGPVKPGKEFVVKATVSNAASAELSNVQATLLRDPAIVLYDPATQVLGKLGPRRSAKFTWAACSATPGNYVVMARATAGVFTAESQGALVAVAPGRSPQC